MSTTQYLLDASRMPKHWYNIAADLPSPPPAVLHPGTLQPIGPADLAPLFPMELILQEVSTEREIPIPEPVREVFKLWRPAPLFRAHRLEKALGTPAKIYYKYEGGSPAGSHKPNTAVPQAWFNAQAGVKKLTTETGAGQWGTALAFAHATRRSGGSAVHIGREHLGGARGRAARWRHAAHLALRVHRRGARAHRGLVSQLRRRAHRAA